MSLENRLFIGKMRLGLMQLRSLGFFVWKNDRFT